MKLFVVALLLAVCAGAVLAQRPRPIDLNNAPALFEKFIVDYHRQYKDAADKARHYEAFLRHLRQINKSNAENPSAVFGINNFADYTPDEEKNMFGILQ